MSESLDLNTQNEDVESVMDSDDEFFAEEEVQEDEAVAGDDLDERASAWDAFDKSGNPDDLPEKERKIFKGFQASFTRKQQELADKIRDVDERLKQATKKDDPEPVIPEGATEAEIIEALKKRQDWLFRHHKDPEQKEQEERLSNEKKIQEAVDRVRAKPGCTPEIMQEMGRLVEEDPDWVDIQFTKKGQDALFELAKANIEKNAKKKETRARQASGSVRLPTRKAGDVDMRTRTKDMSMDEIIERAASDRL